jgi:tRNA threonylcarbamoyladenosine biosynthesis protein TsaB
MIRALAIETSGRVGSVALVQDGMVVAEDEFPHGLKHAAEMIPRIDRLCREQGWRPMDLREVYVSAGPGSFTGLRIGVTLAKTLALATGARLVAVPTVRVLVQNAPSEADQVIIVLDAKRDQIFSARFARTNGSWTEEELARLTDLASALRTSPRPVWLLGEGLPFHEKFWPPDDPQVHRTPPEAWQARASAVAAEGVRMAREGTLADPDRLIPIYIRRPEAEEKLDASRQA